MRSKPAPIPRLLEPRSEARTGTRSLPTADVRYRPAFRTRRTGRAPSCPHYPDREPVGRGVRMPGRPRRRARWSLRNGYSVGCPGSRSLPRRDTVDCRAGDVPCSGSQEPCTPAPGSRPPIRAPGERGKRRSSALVGRRIQKRQARPNGHACLSCSNGLQADCRSCGPFRPEILESGTHLVLPTRELFRGRDLHLELRSLLYRGCIDGYRLTRDLGAVRPE